MPRYPQVCFQLENSQNKTFPHSTASAYSILETKHKKYKQQREKKTVKTSVREKENTKGTLFAGHDTTEKLCHIFNPFTPVGLEGWLL